MKVVLIPGMDGTGVLFDGFIKHVPSGVEVLNVPLIQSPDYGYEDQAKYVLSKIGEKPFVLVAESYSGMVAYHVYKMGSENLKAIVFAASFLACPSALVKYASFMPIALLKNGLIPRSLVGRFLFGQFYSKELVSSFYDALNSVDTKVLKRRLRQIEKLSEPEETIQIPCTYIRPKGDNLVSKSSIKSFQKLCEKLHVCEVEGTHFVLQTNPGECWKLIKSACF